MLSRTTKTGNTMYETTYNDQRHGSMDREAVELLEAGKVELLNFYPKDGIVFVGVKGRLFNSSGAKFLAPHTTPTQAVPISALPRMQRSEVLSLLLEIQKKVNLAVSGLS